MQTGQKVKLLFDKYLQRAKATLNMVWLLPDTVVSASETAAPLGFFLLTTLFRVYRWCNQQKDRAVGWSSLRENISGSEWGHRIIASPTGRQTSPVEFNTEEIKTKRSLWAPKWDVWRVGETFSRSGAFYVLFWHGLWDLAQTG